MYPAYIIEGISHEKDKYKSYAADRAFYGRTCYIECRNCETMYTGVSLFTVKVTLPGAAVCYAVTFLMTDVIGELWGKKEADRTVVFGLIGKIFATLLIIFTQHLPAADEHMQQVYDALPDLVSAGSSTKNCGQPSQQ